MTSTLPESPTLAGLSRLAILLREQLSEALDQHLVTRDGQTYGTKVRIDRMMPGDRLPFAVVSATSPWGGGVWIFATEPAAAIDLGRLAFRVLDDTPGFLPGHPGPVERITGPSAEVEYLWKVVVPLGWDAGQALLDEAG